jgi:hypothetical protein
VRRYAPVRGGAAGVRGARPDGSWGRGGAGPGEWTAPRAIAIDGRGRVYTIDRADDRGQIFTPAGADPGAFGEDVEPAPVPAATAPSALPSTLCSNGGGFGVEITAAPASIPRGDLFQMEVQVRDGCRSGPPSANIELQVVAVMPGHGHGMNTHPRVAPAAPGRFLVTGLRFHMPGSW